MSKEVAKTSLQLLVEAGKTVSIHQKSTGGNFEAWYDETYFSSGITPQVAIYGLWTHYRSEQNFSDRFGSMGSQVGRLADKRQQRRMGVQ